MTRCRKCAVCGTTHNIARHHIYQGCRRQTSEKYGAVIDLCFYHHNGSNQGVHFNKELDLKLKRDWQRKFEAEHGHDEFMKIFGRNYLE
jgi:hypothetical protein